MLIAIDHVLDTNDIGQFRTELEAAVWQDGSATAGSISRLVKNNLQLVDGSALAVRLGNHILQKLGNNPFFISATLPARIYPPKFNCYTEGGCYGTHIDSALMPVPGTDIILRSDISATLFLSEPDEYEGGELEVETPFGAQSIKLNAGSMILYPSSSLHRVTPVTQGKRIAAFFWIQSMVREEADRTLLFDLDQSIQRLTTDLSSDNEELLTMTGIYHNLLRRWADT